MEESPQNLSLATDPTEAMRESLRKQVECPVCYEIRRDQRIYVCVKGHHICYVCIGRVHSCPQGQCKYRIPATRNRALEAIVENMNFTFPCSYSPECQFKAQRSQLIEHEATCDYRVVICPHGECPERIAVNQVLDHVQKKHNFVFMNTNAFNTWSQDLPWTNGAHPMEGISEIWGDTKDQKHFIMCAQESMGQIYFWMLMLADEKQSDQYVCSISLQRDDNRITFDSIPVYPIDLPKERIWADSDCAVINRRCLKEFVPVDGGGAGAGLFFTVTFTLVDIIAEAVDDGVRAGTVTHQRRKSALPGRVEPAASHPTGQPPTPLGASVGAVAVPRQDTPPPDYEAASSQRERAGRARPRLAESPSSSSDSYEAPRPRVHSLDLATKKYLFQKYCINR